MSASRPLSAAAAVLLAMLLIGFIDNFVVRIAEDAGLWQFHAMRSLMALPLILVLVPLGFGSLRPRRLMRVLVRSLCVGTAMLLYFGALGFLPVAEVAAGLFTAPLFVLAISAWWLGQSVGPVRTAAGILGFVGVLLVLRPDAGALSPVVAMPVLAGLFYAVGGILTRTWCADEPPLALLAWFFLILGFWGVLGLAAIAVVGPGGEGFLTRDWAVPTPAFLGWTLLQAVGSIVAVGLIIRGYQMADASFVAVFEYTLLIFAAGWSWLLYRESIDGWAWAGIALIIMSGTVIALRGRTSAGGEPAVTAQ